MQTKTPRRKQVTLPNGKYDALFLDLVDCKDGTYRLRFMVWSPENNITENYATNSKFIKSTIINSFFHGKSVEEMSRSQWQITLGDNPKRSGLKTIIDFRPRKWTMGKDFVRYMELWQCDGGSTLSPERKAYLQRKAASDPKYARTQKVRKLLRYCLDGKATDEVCMKVTGKNFKELWEYLESTIKESSININDRTTFQVDHIKPLKEFNVFSPEEILKANHYKNLQLLTPKQNREKYVS